MGVPVGPGAPEAPVQGSTHMGRGRGDCSAARGGGYPGAFGLHPKGQSPLYDF